MVTCSTKTGGKQEDYQELIPAEFNFDAFREEDTAFEFVDAETEEGSEIAEVYTPEGDHLEMIEGADTESVEQPPQQEEEEELAPIAAVVSSEMSRAKFEELGTEEMIQYLVSQKVVLSDKVRGILREQEINGDSLTGMTKEDLVSCGVPMGVAVQIIKRIPSDCKSSLQFIVQPEKKKSKTL